jgi:hypothetical protein
MLSLNICLSDIPEAKIYKAKNGKQYITISVMKLKEKNKYGNTHTCYIRQTKEEREAKQDKVYVGNGQKIDFK